MVSDAQPHQQAAAIIRSLTGAAREITRTITGGEIMNGGIHNGVRYDPQPASSSSSSSSERIAGTPFFGNTATTEELTVFERKTPAEAAAIAASDATDP